MEQQLIQAIKRLSLKPLSEPFLYQYKNLEGDNLQVVEVTVSIFEGIVTHHQGCRVVIQMIEEQEEDGGTEGVNVFGRVRLTYAGLDLIFEVKGYNPTLEDCKKAAIKELKYLLRYRVNFGIIDAKKIKQKGVGKTANVRASGGKYDSFSTKYCSN